MSVLKCYVFNYLFCHLFRGMLFFSYHYKNFLRKYNNAEMKYRSTIYVQFSYKLYERTIENDQYCYQLMRRVQSYEYEVYEYAHFVKHQTFPFTYCESISLSF